MSKEKKLYSNILYCNEGEYEKLIEDAKVSDTHFIAFGKTSKDNNSFILEETFINPFDLSENVPTGEIALIQKVMQLTELLKLLEPTLNEEQEIKACSILSKLYSDYGFNSNIGSLYVTDKPLEEDEFIYDGDLRTLPTMENFLEVVRGEGLEKLEVAIHTMIQEGKHDFLLKHTDEKIIEKTKEEKVYIRATDVDEVTFYHMLLFIQNNLMNKYIEFDKKVFLSNVPKNHEKLLSSFAKEGINKNVEFIILSE